MGHFSDGIRREHLFCCPVTVCKDLEISIMVETEELRKWRVAPHVPVADYLWQDVIGHSPWGSPVVQGSPADFDLRLMMFVSTIRFGRRRELGVFDRSDQGGDIG